MKTRMLMINMTIVRSFVLVLTLNNQSELKKQVSGEDYLRGMHGAQACV